MAQRPGMLDPLRQRVRRFQVVVGVGFAGYIGGNVLWAAVMNKLQYRLTPGSGITSAVVAVGSQSWAWLVLPALFYALARVIELRPWSTAVGGVLTGTLFMLTIQWVSGGTEALGAISTTSWLLIAASALAGVGACRAAVQAGTRTREAAAEAARKAAEAKKDQYAEFAREAERVANRVEARTEAPAAPETADAAAPESDQKPDAEKASA